MKRIYQTQLYQIMSYFLKLYKIKIIRLRKKKGTKENIKLVKIQFLRKRQFLL